MIEAWANYIGTSVGTHGEIDRDVRRRIHKEKEKGDFTELLNF